MPHSTALLEFTVYCVSYITYDQTSVLAEDSNNGGSSQIRTGFSLLKRQDFTVKVYNPLAAVLGLEPRTTESKSVVLPLHHTATITKQQIFKERCQSI